MFEKRLKKAMQDLNLKQSQVAGMTGKSKGSISQYLSGKQVPSEDGLNIKNPSTFAADDGQVGVLYAADHGFADDTGAAPYEDTGIRVPYVSWSYISAFGYSEAYDWLFVGVEGKGNSSVPVGDCVQNVNPGWHVAISGAGWNRGAGAGVFYLYLGSSAGDRYRDVSGRSVYIPSRKKELDDAA